VSARRRTLGDEHPHTLDSINNLAGLRWTLGRKAEALEAWRSALEVSRRVLGEAHPITQQSLTLQDV
jgi:hypothetical protein